MNILTYWLFGDFFSLIFDSIDGVCWWFSVKRVFFNVICSEDDAHRSPFLLVFDIVNNSYCSFSRWVHIWLYPTIYTNILFFSSISACPIHIYIHMCTHRGHWRWEILSSYHFVFSREWKKKKKKKKTCTHISLRSLNCTWWWYSIREDQRITWKAHGKTFVREETICRGGEKKKAKLTVDHWRSR